MDRQLVAGLRYERVIEGQLLSSLLADATGVGSGLPAWAAGGPGGGAGDQPQGGGATAGPNGTSQPGEREGGWKLSKYWLQLPTQNFIH